MRVVELSRKNPDVAFEFIDKIAVEVKSFERKLKRLAEEYRIDEADMKRYCCHAINYEFFGDKNENC
jgi:hypothetical protein